MTETDRSLLQTYFAQNQPPIIEFIRQLCEIESPSRDVEGIREIVEFLENEAGKLNCVNSIEKITAENLGEHLLIHAFQQKNSNQKQILLLGHSDTVHPRGSLAERPYRIEGDKIFAPGIFDMKAGIALMFSALKAFDELNLTPKNPVTILLVCDEEIGSPSGRELVEAEARKSAACLVFEPSGKNGEAKTGRKGTGLFTLKTHGIPSHAGLEPQRGASAILEIARQIPLVQKLNDYEKGSTANVCTIRGGTATNVIPAEAEAEIDVRFSSMNEAEYLEKEIHGLKNFDARVALEISGEINRPPLERTEKVVKLYGKARMVAEKFDYELNEIQVGGASDGNFVGALDIPVLDGLGVKGDGAHTFHEYISASDIAPRAAFLTALLAENFDF